MRQATRWLTLVVSGVVLAFAWQMWSSGQQPAAGKSQADAKRLEFEVVQSFDAKYLGDTPGHMGRAGGLTVRRPRVALGDRVYRGEEQVGVVTGLEWNRANNSVDIEFDPTDHARICVGDAVWVALDDNQPAAQR